MDRSGPVTLSEIEQALEALGGEATWDTILDQLTKVRDGDYSHYHDWMNYKTTAFQVIQQYCSGYKKYRGTPRFEKVVGQRFRLISRTATVGQAEHPSSPSTPEPTPIAVDIENPTPPERVKQETYRILRDTALAREVKESNHFRCHICGHILKIKDGLPYAEAHHVKPLGAPHDGPDVRDNILCVCPNHHVQLDYGAIHLDGTQLANISKEYIDYHNEQIFRNSEFTV